VGAMLQKNGWDISVVKDFVEKNLNSGAVAS
jgi:hypothetical protein